MRLAMTKRQKHDGLRRSALPVVVLPCLALVGCTSVGDAIVQSGLAPTSNIHAAETSRPQSYPSVTVTPRAPAPDFPTAEQQKLKSELEAARTANQTILATPVTRPLPRTPPATATHAAAPTPPAPAARPPQSPLELRPAVPPSSSAPAPGSTGTP